MCGFLDHDPDRVRQLRCQPVEIERRQKSDNRFWNPDTDGGNVGMTSGRLIGPHVDTSGPPHDVPPIDGTLECDSGNAEPLEIARPYDLMGIEVPQKPLDLAGGSHPRRLGVTNTMPKFIRA